METFLETYHFLTKAYIFLFFSFCLGAVGLFILACRMNGYENPDQSVSYSSVASEFCTYASDMADNLGGLTLIVIFVFSIIGWIFLLLSFTPRFLLRKLGFT